MTRQEMKKSPVGLRKWEESGHEREAMLARMLSCLASHAGAPTERYGSQLTPHAEVLPQHSRDG